ncbi:MAG: AfsR/SARP family transcriptional regulator, partial [Aestuariivirga sp.]
MQTSRQSGVMANVKEAQNPQLRPSERAAVLRICLLGPISIEIDGAPVIVASRKARALLGYLVQREGVESARDILTGLLWGERGEAQARASLRQTLSELRGALAGAPQSLIAANNETVGWVSGTAYIDTRVVNQAVKSADENALREAAGIIRGEFLEGLSINEPAFEQWLTSEREKFRLQACAINTKLMEHSESRGDFEEALGHGLKLVSFDPLQEHAHRAVMRIYAAQGRPDAALSQFERLKRELSTQLGVQPDPQTAELARSIKAQRREGPARSV